MHDQNTPAPTAAERGDALERDTLYLMTDPDGPPLWSVEDIAREAETDDPMVPVHGLLRAGLAWRPFTKPLIPRVKTSCREVRPRRGLRLARRCQRRLLLRPHSSAVWKCYGSRAVWPGSVVQPQRLTGALGIVTIPAPRLPKSGGQPLRTQDSRNLRKVLLHPARIAAASDRLLEGTCYAASATARSRLSAHINCAMIVRSACSRTRSILRTRSGARAHSFLERPNARSTDGKMPHNGSNRAFPRGRRLRSAGWVPMPKTTHKSF
jgi:hypothetical protein